MQKQVRNENAGQGAAAAPAELVCLSGVHKWYRNGVAGVHAVRGVDLRVAAGDMVSICGASGHGKTSLLNLIGLIDTASEGSVAILGRLAGDLSEQARADLRASMIGHVFQSFSLIPVMTALENVLLPLVLGGRIGAAGMAPAQARARELLARLGLATETHHYPRRLDPGQCQRVAIARALITQPPLVVADEPTSRLDPGAIRRVNELFADQQRRHGTSFVISTRDQRQLNPFTRAFLLSEGRLCTSATDAGRGGGWVAR
jgi:putative ABC transport system ATP-binding protein